LAGYLEGEGSFCKGPPSGPDLPYIQVSSVDEDVIAKVAKLFCVSYHKISEKRSIQNGWKVPYATRIRGKRAVELMIVLKPLMGNRRQEQITIALDSYNAKSYKLTEEKVKEIKLALHQGMKQGDVAKQFGLRRETVNKINTGKFWPNVKI